MILLLRSTNKYSQIFFWSIDLLIYEYIHVPKREDIPRMWRTLFRKCIKCKYLERSRTVANGTTTSEILPYTFPIPSLKPWRYYYLRKLILWRKEDSRTSRDWSRDYISRDYGYLEPIYEINFQRGYFKFHDFSIVYSDHYDNMW